MKIFQSKNIFESSKFLYTFNKLTGNLFFTISEDVPGIFEFKSSKFDLILFFSSLLFTFWSLNEAAQTRSWFKSRSVIIEFGFLLNLNLLVVKPILLIFHNFYNRRGVFQILKNISWIDKKVCKSRTERPKIA